MVAVDPAQVDRVGKEVGMDEALVLACAGPQERLCGADPTRDSAGRCSVVQGERTWT